VLPSVIAALTGGGCYDLHLSDCSVQCGPAGACPSGMICDNGYCGHRLGECSYLRKDGSAGDGARGRIDAAVDGTRDASDGPAKGSDASAVDASRADASTVDASAVDAWGTADARREAQGDASSDGSTDGGGTDACPPQHYTNIVRHRCVPAHDLTGDGKADLIAVNYAGIDALISTGSSFLFQNWFTGKFYGTGGTYAADVTGSGFADGVAFDGASEFALGTGGPSFGTIPANLKVWLPMPFQGEIATSVVDVDGDGRADAVDLNGHEILVALSTGESFEEPTQWSAIDLTPYAELWMADVNGDGMWDTILLGNSSVEVCLSTGTAFAPPVVWDQSPLYSDIVTLFADVDGDGRMDGIQIENESILVSLSNGHGFDPPTVWYAAALYGDSDTIVADANGDGMADVIVVDAGKVIVALSTGTSFLAPAVWYNGDFHRDINLDVAPDPGDSFIAIGVPSQ
jgi:hypothetical protein